MAEKLDFVAPKGFSLIAADYSQIELLLSSCSNVFSDGILRYWFRSLTNS